MGKVTNKPLLQLSLACLFWMQGALFVSAQESVKFDNFSIDNGLSQSSINDVIQDKRGFIWIATQDGLNRYDGYSFRIFKKDPENNKSLSNNFIHSLCLDKNGMIWIGTDGGGLNKFDPITETFTRIPLSAEYRFVYATTLGPDGYIWIGTEKGGITRIHPKTGKKSAFKHRNELGTRFIQSLFTDKEGNVWIGTGDNGLFVYLNKKNELHSFNTADNHMQTIGSDVIWSIRGDTKNTIWVATNSGLFSVIQKNGHYKVKSFRHQPGNKNSIGSNAVRAVLPVNDGSVYTGTWGAGIDKLVPVRNGYRIFHYQNTEFIERSLVDDKVQCMFDDRSGCIWIGMGNGLSKFDPLKQNFDHIDDRPGDPKSLNDRHVWCIYSVEPSVVWVGTGKGLTKVNRDNARSRYFPHEGRNLNSSYSNSVLALHVDKENTVWAGCSDGLFKLDEKRGKYIPVPFIRNFDPDGDNRVYRIVEDKRGFIWVGSKKGLSIVNKQTGKFYFYEHEISDRNSITPGIVRAVCVDSKDQVWISTDDGTLSRVELKMVNGEPVITGFKKYLPFSNKGETEDGMVTTIWEEPYGLLWLGTYGGGLIRFHPEQGTFTAYTEAQGLSNNAVYGVLGDGAGNLWMSTNRGISRFNTTNEKFRNYQEHDGLQSNEFNVGAYFKASYGEMFFGGINGLNSFYPDRVKQNITPPEVVISDILLFNESIYHKIEKGKRLSLRYKQNNLSIYFSALHFSNPANNRYKYMLEGLDERMNEVGTMRSAHYYGIPPGDYTFKVYACNSDGIWNDNPSVLHIEIVPPFWGTWWFRTFLILFALALVWGIWQARMYNIKSHRIRLAMEVRERTREVTLQNQQIEEQKRIIEKEKEKVEQLLLNVLPQDTAEELKTRGKASARSYSRVTVMFTDFRGFTQIAEKVRPAELVSRLDSYFIEFDNIIQNYGLEKIKTIGDSYMCAGGLPIRNKSNPIDTVLAALAIQKYMRDNHQHFQDMPGGAWDLRIGINTGDVIAGVIGTKRFAYDIWGNTVNVASRMETSCESGAINVSGSTYAVIEPFFECTYRGKIPAKNKGDIDMYYVHRLKPELSADEDGVIPNEKFKKYVDLYLYSGINYRKAERHIMKVLHDRLPDNLYYHGIHHMYDVIAAVERIALMEGITGEEMFVLKSAATYHDAGFVEQYAKNEPIGARMAKEILPIYGYTPEQVAEVERLIYATIIPHNPKSHLEEIICDADLDYLGRDDFHEIADTLRRELKERGIVDKTRAWDEMQVKFLTMHKYFTKSAIQMRQAKKEKHIEDIKQRLANTKYEDD